MSGKKGKKIKAKAIPLQEFLGDTPVPPAPKFKSWADEEEDDPNIYSARPKDPVILPTAPRAARDQCFSEENVPMNPPYVAYISNLPYDVEEEDIYEFFQDMQIENLRLPKDANKFKGYGYVEFKDRQSLIDALMMVDTNLKTRRVRIEVSNSSNDDRRGGGRMGRMGDNRREYSPERTGSDWRVARSDDPRLNDEREDRGFRRGGAFERRGDDMRGDRDSGFEDAKPSNWRDVPREPLPDLPTRPSFRDSRGGGGFEDRGGRFSDRGMRGRDGSRERDGGGFGSRRYFNDDPDKDRDRWSNLRSAPREPREPRESREPLDSNSSSNAAPPASEPAVPMTRPKLELKPRSKPIESEATSKTEPESNSQDKSAAPTPAANIFGAAKPVDTAAREREIEERLAKTAKERSKEAGPREGTWGRHNGESRFEERSRSTWRSRPDPSEQNSKDLKNSRDSSKPRSHKSDSRGSSSSRGAAISIRGPSKHDSAAESHPEPEKEKKKKEVVELTEEEELKRMPKATDNQSPNFVASNKYSMLPDDVDPDDIEE